MVKREASVWCACMCGCLCVGVPSPWKHRATIYRREPMTPRFLWLSWVTQAHLRVTSFSGLLQGFWGSSSWEHPTCQRPSQSLRPAKSFKMAKANSLAPPDPRKARRLLLPHTLGWRLNGSHRNAFPSALCGRILVLNVPLRSQPSFPSLDSQNF